jgi:hypothetical protein
MLPIYTHFTTLPHYHSITLTTLTTLPLRYSTIHHSPFTIHHQPSTIHHPPSTIHLPLPTIHHPPSTSSTLIQPGRVARHVACLLPHPESMLSPLGAVAFDYIRTVCEPFMYGHEKPPASSFHRGLHFTRASSGVQRTDEECVRASIPDAPKAKRWHGMA